MNKRDHVFNLVALMAKLDIMDGIEVKFTIGPEEYCVLINDARGFRMDLEGFWGSYWP